MQNNIVRIRLQDFPNSDTDPITVVPRLKR